jgi:hypothetical protein
MGKKAALTIQQFGTVGIKADISKLNTCSLKN